MLRALRRVAMACIGLAWGAQAAPDAVSGAVECGRARVQAETPNATPQDFAAACHAVEHGTAFMRARDLDSGAQVHITFVDRLPSSHGLDLVGQYRRADAAIRILTTAHCLAECAEHEPFACPPSREICQSFIVHEVVHALANDFLELHSPPRLAMAYLAYVAQFESLPAAQREQVLAGPGAVAADLASQINEETYLIDPSRFGIACYLHYRRPGNGEAFLCRMLGLAPD